VIIAIIAIIGLGACHSEKSVSNIDEKTEPDTSSHEVDWQVYDFGHYPHSSVFRDVAIIDENNIWVVGEIIPENVY
jgi:thioredoxin reductase